MVFPRGLVIKNLPIMQETTCNAEDSGLIPGSGICPRKGNDHPLQYTCLGNSMDREAWGAAVHRDTKESDMVTKQQDIHTYLIYNI